MTNISSKQTTHISTVLPEWSIHKDENCTSCDLHNKLKKGGRRRKRKATGRPKATSSIWSRADSDSLLASAHFHCEKLPLDVTMNQMHENNSNMNICICYFCRNIMCDPVIIQICQHAFCALCLVKNCEGKEGPHQCLECLTVFSYKDLQPCKTRQSCLQNLKIKCVCEEQFLITEYKKHSCGGLQTPHIYEDAIDRLDPQQPIPKPIERMALKVVKHKLAASGNGTVEFFGKSTRVRISDIELKVLKPLYEEFDILTIFSNFYIIIHYFIYFNRLECCAG